MKTMLKTVRAAIVGASSLYAKELAGELNGSNKMLWDLKLLDADAGISAAEGARITAAGDTALLVQPITADAFDGMDVVFFTEDGATTRKHWAQAVSAKAAVVDMTGALSEEVGVATCAPALTRAGGGQGRVVVSAHPAAVMLAALATRLRILWPDVVVAATVMVPASEYGSVGLDALHEQTTALLTFQAIPEDVFGGQAAFNLYARSGSEAKTTLNTVRMRVLRDFEKIAGDATPGAPAMQFVQAPVFHGYAASIFLDVAASVDEVATVLNGGLVEIVSGGEVCSLQSAAEGRSISVAIAEGGARGVWLWCVCDNVKLAAQNALACATTILQG